MNDKNNEHLYKKLLLCIPLIIILFLLIGLIILICSLY